MENTEGKKVLIVDDERDLVLTLQLRFEVVEKWNIFTAYDGEEGLEKVKKEEPHLILLDVIMPKMNGFQVCRMIKESPSLRTTPVILLTAMAQESDRFWGNEVRANAYITKPFEIGDLTKKIKTLMNISQPV